MAEAFHKSSIETREKDLFIDTTTLRHYEDASFSRICYKYNLLVFFTLRQLFSLEISVSILHQIKNFIRDKALRGTASFLSDFIGMDDNLSLIHI